MRKPYRREKGESKSLTKTFWAIISVVRHAWPSEFLTDDQQSKGNKNHT